jgi:hypothetical protein
MAGSGAPQSGHLAAMGGAGIDSTGAGMFSRQALHWTTKRFELSGPGNKDEESLMYIVGATRLLLLLRSIGVLTPTTKNASS